VDLGNVGKGKGHKDALARFTAAVRGEAEPPSLRHAVLATLVTFAANRSIEIGEPVWLDASPLGL
jgi:hypothetical protein